jgi:hypothetical protein
MGDPNGNFVRDFQGDGFHSRVFELACFAYLEEAGLTITRSQTLSPHGEAPDSATIERAKLHKGRLRVQQK